MRLSLRPKIILFTVLPLLTLTIITLWIVNRAISSEVRTGIDDGLRRASATLESTLESRSHYLAVAGEVIVRDPRFFSSLTIPGSHRDPQFRATVAGVAREFNAITKAELFEVFDAAGGIVASVGSERLEERERGPLVASALAEQPRTAAVAAPGRHFQVAVTPVLAGGRVVGALLVGQNIGRELAAQLRDFTRSEVTFLSGGVVTGSTLDDGEDRRALEETVRRSRSPKAGEAGPAEPQGSIVEVTGRRHHFLTLVREIPHADRGQEAFYAVQRSLDTETAFLRDIQARLVELGVLAAILALAAGFIVSERITSPVRRLVRAAEEIERGNYDYPIHVRPGDEIAYLATRFDEMRESQRAYVARLKEVARVKSEFINVASHELRTPVSIIRGFQELFVGGGLGPLTAQQEQAMEAIGRSVGTLTKIAEDATRVAQVEESSLPLRFADHDIGDLLARAASAARAASGGRRVVIRVEPSADPDPVRVDGDRLSEAVTNLIRNGVRFTPDGGEVTVRSRRELGRLLIEVEDTGIGLSSEQRAALLEHAIPVRDSKHHHSSDTLEFNSSGLGLGLSIARGIVRMHGGSLEIESAVGRGSVFRIILPLEPDAAREAA